MQAKYFVNPAAFEVSEYFVGIIDLRNSSGKEKQKMP